MVICSIDIENIVVKNKFVFYRADFNVPIHDEKILDDTRIKIVSQYIRKLSDKGAKIVLASHIEPLCGMEFLQPIIEKYLNKKVKFAHGCVDSHIEELKRNMREGDILLLENLRFHKEEKKCDSEFAKRLSENIDIYVNDAFSVSHREHASMFLMPQIVDSFAGELLNKEIQNIEKVLNGNFKKKMAIIGGSKAHTKIKVVEKLIEKLDIIVVGGELGNVFLKAKNIDIGSSFCNDDLVDKIPRINKKLREYSCKIMTPGDVVVKNEKRFGKKIRHINLSKIKQNEIIKDIGRDGINFIKGMILSCDALIMNGALGVFEEKEFNRGTFEIIREIARQHDLFSVAGGGHTIAAINEVGVYDSFNYISLGGGAFLEYLANGSLPCIDVLKNGVKK